MMRSILLLFILTLSFTAFAQDSDPQNMRRGREEIESYKRAYLTEKLDLTPELAEKFWPLYNEFGKKRNDLRIERSKLRLDLSKSELDDNEADRIVKTELSLRKKEIELEEEYYEKFREVLTPTKLVALLRAEMDFNREMLRRLRKGHPGGQGRN